MSTRGPNMTAEEKKVVRMMRHDQGESPEDIATFFGRDQSTICRLLFRKKAKGARGPGAGVRQNPGSKGMLH